MWWKNQRTRKIILNQPVVTIKQTTIDQPELINDSNNPSNITNKNNSNGVFSLVKWPKNKGLCILAEKTSNTETNVDWAKNDIGANIKCSPHPNCKIIHIKDHLYLFPIKPISENEELTVYQNDLDNWFKPIDKSMYNTYPPNRRKTETVDTGVDRKNKVSQATPEMLQNDDRY